MKSNIFIIVFISCAIAFGQTEEKKWTFDFTNLDLKESLLKIQDESGYQVYVAEEWLPAKVIAERFSNQSLKEVLSHLLEATELNYFITQDQRIILTRNSIIYDELPENFFGEEKTFVENLEDTEPPSAIYLSDKSLDKPAKIPIVYIGKEQKRNRKNVYTISGTVTHLLTGKPISNIDVLVRKLAKGTTTNDNGYYELELPIGENLVETSALGFEDSGAQIILYNNGEYNIQIKEDFELLDEVVVSADLISNVDEATTGNTVIGAEDSKNIPMVLGERDILKVATTLPGVTSAGEGASGFNVRGGKTDQNLILLDNAVVYNPSHFFGLFQALNPFAIDDINIYKGAVPAEFGGRLSSVFKINSKQADTEKFKGEVSIGPVTANAVIEIPLVDKKSGILLAGRGAYSDWVLRSLKDVSLQNSSANFYDAMLKYQHTFNEKNTVQATAYYSKDAFSITSDSLYRYSNRLGAIKWYHRFNDKNSANLFLNNSQYKFDIGFDGSVNANFNQKYEINETELKLKFRYLYNEKHKFDYGISSKLYNVQPGEIAPKSNQDLITPIKIAQERALESGIFVSDNYTINEKLLLDLGLRYSFFMALGERQQRTYDPSGPKSENTVLDTLNFSNNQVIKTYGGPEIRVSARYFLGENFSVKASFNNAYQFIHTLSNNTTASPIDTWKLSDYNIKPQKADQFSVGLYKNLSGNTYELSLEGFYKRQKQLLDFKTGAQLSLNRNIETEVIQGDGKAYGIEFFVRKNTGKLNGWLGYTYSRSLLRLNGEFREEQVNNGEFFPSNFDKPHDFSLVLNYKLTNRYSFSANFIYQTGRPVTFPVGNYEFDGAEYVLYSDRNRYRISDYYRLDVGINIEGNHKVKKIAHSFWNISLYNVFGRNNPYSVFFVSDEGEVKALQSSIFAVPIPSITYNFKF